MRNISTTLPEADEGERSEATITMEESFTIHLGMSKVRKKYP